MKTLILITFLLFLSHKTTAQRCSCDSLCYCETLAQEWKLNWNKWVQNSDTVKLISINYVGVVETESNKKKYIELLTADTAWFAHPAYGKSVYVEFLKYDSAQGKDIQHYNSDRKLIRSYSTYQKKELAIISLNKSIKLTDRYYEVYFQINGRVIMSPTICKTNQYICTGFLDNIISHLSVNRY